MRKIKIEEGKQCPKCGRKEDQAKTVYNRSGTQRRKHKERGTGYTFLFASDVFLHRRVPDLNLPLAAGSLGRHGAIRPQLKKSPVTCWRLNVIR